MKIITEEILDQAIAAAKQGHLDDLTYKQDSWCGTACCVLGFARYIAGREGIQKGPQDGEIVGTPRAQMIQALMRNGSPEILDVMGAVRSDGSLPDGLSISGNLNLHDCTSLVSLPAGLTVGGYLDLAGCTKLDALPDGLTVGGCLDLSGCTGLELLHDGLTVGGNLYLVECPATVPETAKIGGHIYR